MEIEGEVNVVKGNSLFALPKQRKSWYETLQGFFSFLSCQLHIPLFYLYKVSFFLIKISYLFFGRLKQKKNS